MFWEGLHTFRDYLMIIFQIIFKSAQKKLKNNHSLDSLSHRSMPEPALANRFSTLHMWQMDFLK
jgi:hypothetical protein